MKWNHVEGWLLDVEANKLQEIAKDKVVLEIGAFKGKSTCCFAEVAKHVYSIDPFTYSDDALIDTKEITTLNDFLLNIEEFKDKVTYFQDYSYNVLKKKKILADVYFIDGDHSYESVKRDIQLIRKYLKSNDIVAFHDYQNIYPGVTQAAREEFGYSKYIFGTMALYYID
jgi:predicted O-methyltransferase YrrM